jgi:hypothetical protein
MRSKTAIYETASGTVGIEKRRETVGMRKSALWKSGAHCG